MKPDKVLVCTVATHAAPGLNRLSESCRKYGIKLTIFGYGEQFGGSCWRLKTLSVQLSRLQDEYDYVLFVDGFDTVFATGLDEIMAKYLRLRTPFLMSAETNCWPWADPWPGDYPAAPTRYQFLNAGGYIGETKRVVKLMKALHLRSYSDSESDQRLWARAYISGRYNIRLDHYCDIFQCLWDAEPDLQPGQRIRNIRTGSTPCIFHGNGRADMTSTYALVLGDGA